MTSLNQKDIEQTSKINAMYTVSCELLKPCITKTPEVVSVKIDMLVSMGQGEGDTRWKGWD